MKPIVLNLFWLLLLCAHPPRYTHTAFSVSSSSLFTDSSQPLGPHNEVLALAHCSHLITHSTPLASQYPYKRGFFKFFSSSTLFAKLQSYTRNYFVNIFIWNSLQHLQSNTSKLNSAHHPCPLHHPSPVSACGTNLRPTSFDHPESFLSLLSSSRSSSQSVNFSPQAESLNHWQCLLFQKISLHLCLGHANSCLPSGLAPSWCCFPTCQRRVVMSQILQHGRHSPAQLTPTDLPNLEPMVSEGNLTL